MFNSLKVIVKLPRGQHCPNTFNILQGVNSNLLNFILDLIENDGTRATPSALAPPVGQDLVAGAHHHVLQGQAPPIVVPSLAGHRAIRSNLLQEGLEIFNLVVNATKICNHAQGEGGREVDIAGSVHLEHQRLAGVRLDCCRNKNNGFRNIVDLIPRIKFTAHIVVASCCVD